MVGGVTALLLVASKLRIVLFPVAVALLVAAPLRPIAARLERFIGRSGAAIVSVLGLVAIVCGIMFLAGRAMASDADQLATAVSEGIDDIRAWLVDQGIDQSQLDQLRDEVGGEASAIARRAVSGAVVAGEVIAGLVLAIVLAIFVVRDSDAAVEAISRRTSERRAARVRLSTAAGWTALRRYLLGAAILGTVEAIAIGTAVALVGSPLAVPVAAFTFVAAFVPIVGAIVAGVVAVLAALVTGGVTGALIVGGVALVVQQLDGDLLAPLVYGRATKLHPAAVLLAITTGTALAGLPGAVLAVPLVTVVVAARRATGEDDVTAEVRANGDVRDVEREASG